MSSSSRRGVLLVTSLLCLCMAYAAGFGAYGLWARQASQPKPLGVFWEAWNHVEQSFYSELPSPRERTYGAIRGALTLLGDPYTIFVEPPSHELEQDQLRGAFGGVGVELWRSADGQMALSPYPASPAERAGVRKGDVLLALDGDPIADTTTIDDVQARIHGEVGTPLTFTLSRPPTPPFDLTITRAEIQIPSATWRVLDQSPEIGIIHVTGFTERTGDEVLAALQELRHAGCTGLILDLRDNPGGLLDPAVAVAGQFLADGIVLLEVGRDGQERVFQAQSGGAAAATPLAVLINGGTASAAEIVAGALQDHGRAPLIGEHTFGKGSVQLIYSLSDGSSLHVTSAIWLTPKRRQIQGQGLAPDISIPRGDGPQDEQLNRAVGYLQSQN